VLGFEWHRRRAGLQGLDDLGLGGADLLRELGRSRQATLARAELDLRAPDPRGELADRPGRADEWRAVAQVVADLALDRGDGDGAKLVAAIGLEAVDGLDQPDSADLHEVVDRLAPARIPPRDGSDEAHVLLDQARARFLRPPWHAMHRNGCRARRE
jgi:hypothetical protein